MSAKKSQHKRKAAASDLNPDRSDAGKFRDILLITNDWIWEIDTEGRFTFTSGQIKQILGYEPEEIIGKYVFDLFLPQEKEHLQEEILKLIKLEKPIIERVNWNLTKDGKKVCLVTTGIPIYDENNKLTGYRGVDKDITRQKQSEEQLLEEIDRRKKIEKELKAASSKAETSSSAKSDFLTKIGHEIRTPMNGIIGTSVLLKESGLNNEQNELLEIIETSANNILSIIDDILDISRIESGKLKLDEIHFNLIELLNEIERQHSALAKEKNLDFSVEIKPGVPKFLVGDSARIKQIIVNLLNNAFKFTKRGSVTTSVEKINEDEENIELLFKVKDTGIGLSESDRDHLFNELTNPLSPISKTFGGSGLGLLISKKIAEFLGGRIGFESQAVNGSVFWFTVVLNPGENPDPKPLEKPEDESMDTGNQMRILVAEDNIINQKVVMATLRQHGHMVEIAVNGKMAVEMYKKNEYDMILMDIQMPVMDGFTATKEIRKIEKESKRKKIKIIAITANASKEDRTRCLETGMDGYIAKPFKTEDLDAQLNNNGC